MAFFADILAISCFVHLVTLSHVYILKFLAQKKLQQFLVGSKNVKKWGKTSLKFDLNHEKCNSQIADFEKMLVIANQCNFTWKRHVKDLGRNTSWLMTHSVENWKLSNFPATLDFMWKPFWRLILAIFTALNFEFWAFFNIFKYEITKKSEFKPSKL